MNAARACGSACGVRSPERYGRNSTPSAPGSTSSASARSSSYVDARGECVPEPTQRAGGGEHHAHCVPGPGNGVAEDVEARLRLRRVRGQRREDDSRGAENHRERPRPGDADPQRAGRLVPALRRQPVSRSVALAGDFRRLQGRRQPLGRELERLEYFGAPAPLGDVEEQRARGIGDVGRALTRKAEAHIVLRKEDVADPARRPRARARAARAASAP